MKMQRAHTAARMVQRHGANTQRNANPIVH